MDHLLERRVFPWVWMHGKRELQVREQKLKTLREEEKLEFIWIHVKLIGGMNSYGSHKFRLHSGLEMLVACREETEAARGQNSGLLKSLLWCVASVVTNVLIIFVKSST